MKTGNTCEDLHGEDLGIGWPQWSPVMKTGNTLAGSASILTDFPSLNGARS